MMSDFENNGGGDPERSGAEVIPLTGEQIRRAVEARVRKEEDKHGTDDGGGDGPGIDSGFIKKCLAANELGDGELFKALHRGLFVYCKSMDVWLVWQGHHWDIDYMGAAFAGVEDVVAKYAEEMARVGEAISGVPRDDAVPKHLERQRSDLKKRISGLRSSRRRRACLEFAHTSVRPLAIQGDEIDALPWKLACKNGVIDLRSGELHAGRPEEYLLKASPIAWKGIDEPCQVWDKFLNEIFEEDQKLIAFVQRLLGCAAVGKVAEHIIAVFSGRGRNGKGTIVDLLSWILGKMAAPIRAEMLLDQGKNMSSSGPTPDIMALRGMRMAFGSETDEHAKISPSRVKWLTGNDELSGRNPHDKFEVTFRPTHTLFLLTNHKPHAPANDYAFWERVLMVPFELSFVDRDPEDDNERRSDKELPEKLREESSGILAWLVRGCIAWQQQGLAPPRKVREATREYRRDEDILAEFLEDCCETGADDSEGASVLYTVFECWWRLNVSKNPPKQKTFGNLMGQRFEKTKLSGIYRYGGLRLLDHLAEPFEEDEFNEKKMIKVLKFGPE